MSGAVSDDLSALAALRAENLQGAMLQRNGGAVER